jgi:hypothetical protein
VELLTREGLEAVVQLAVDSMLVSVHPFSPFGFLVWVVDWKFRVVDWKFRAGPGEPEPP